MVAGIFAADGYQVIAADSPPAAQRELKRNPRRVRLLVFKPAGEAEKFGRRLHQAQPELRVICTCNDEGGRPLAWLAPDRQAALAKPYALSELLKAARRVLDA
jgi:DNA-binding NtrC family response regulator